jgi:hypothetical protein
MENELLVGFAVLQQPMGLGRLLHGEMALATKVKNARS